jgi:hypothetical protein
MAYLCNNSVYKHSHARRIVFYAAFMLVLLLSPVAQAQEDIVVEAVAVGNPYLVEGIEVDITADNAVEAREQAFEAAQVKGYEELAKRMLSAEEFSTFETPDINTISAYVRDYEVTNEKLSAVRYNGVYKIHFSKKAFSQTQNTNQFGEGGINNIVQKGDTLVLPFYQRAGRSFLWQANPFMQAWVRARNDNAAGRAIIPVGDIDDITQVRDQQASSYDPSRLNAMRLRYNAKQVAILTANPIPQADGANHIQLSFYKAQGYGPELVRQVTIRSYVGENEDQLYNRIVAEASKILGNNPVRAVPTRQEHQDVGTVAPLAGPDAVIAAQLNFSSVREWIETKKKLEAMAEISTLQVQSMSPRAAILSIKFKGGEERLRSALSQVGLSLNNPPQGQMFQLMTGVSAPLVPKQYVQPTISPYRGTGY